ncbi:unnamed protein product, partial [Vitis vinifera]
MISYLCIPYSFRHWKSLLILFHYTCLRMFD